MDFLLDYLLVIVVFFPKWLLASCSWEKWSHLYKPYGRVVWPPPRKKRWVSVLLFWFYWDSTQWQIDNWKKIWQKDPSFWKRPSAFTSLHSHHSWQKAACGRDLTQEPVIIRHFSLLLALANCEKAFSWLTWNSISAEEDVTIVQTNDDHDVDICASRTVSADIGLLPKNTCEYQYHGYKWKKPPAASAVGLGRINENWPVINFTRIILELNWKDAEKTVVHSTRTWCRTTTHISHCVGGLHAPATFSSTAFGSHRRHSHQ